MAYLTSDLLALVNDLSARQMRMRSVVQQLSPQAQSRLKVLKESHRTWAKVSDALYGDDTMASVLQKVYNGLRRPTPELLVRLGINTDSIPREKAFEIGVARIKRQRKSAGGIRVFLTDCDARTVFGKLAENDDTRYIAERIAKALGKETHHA